MSFVPAGRQSLAPPLRKLTSSHDECSLSVTACINLDSLTLLADYNLMRNSLRIDSCTNFTVYTTKMNKLIPYPQFSISTERLLVTPLNQNDNKFILQLVNTEGWIRFIGNRNINSPAEASAYIQRILRNENVSYWVVRLTNNLQPIGIVTLIQRDYLPNRDIGFAFLPEFSKTGYAFEATTAVLNNLPGENRFSHILATTVPENESSIRLLEKIGLRFEREIEVEGEKLFVYGADLDKLKTR
jgi:RimJ/RimL family protein N-acetyltransferase